MPTSHPTWFDWLTVLALVTGPVLALFAQRVLDRLRERDKERKQLYFTLMSTRNQPFSPAHLQALNSVDIIFRDKPTIRSAWKTWLDSTTLPGDTSDASLKEWTNRMLDLRVDLYQIIGREMGYDYTTDHIRRGIYSPRMLDEVEQEWHAVRKGFKHVLEQDYLPVKLVQDVDVPPNKKPADVAGGAPGEGN